MRTWIVADVLVGVDAGCTPRAMTDRSPSDASSSIESATPSKNREITSIDRDGSSAMVTADDIGPVALSLPRTEGALVESGQVSGGPDRLCGTEPRWLVNGLWLPKGRARRIGRRPSEVLYADSIRPALQLGPSGWTRSTRQRCRNSSSTPGAWSYRSELPPSI